MNSNEKFITPIGEIGMVLHQGGSWDPSTNSLTNDAKVIQNQEIKNLIVNKASVLMAQRLAPGSLTGNNGGTFIPDGLQYLEVGIGDWEVSRGLQNPPDPDLADTQLKGPLFRKEFTDWSFLDAMGNRTNTATNVLQLVTTFENNEAIGPLVEMGLFGGDANSTLGSGHMFNYKTFKVN